MENMFIVLHYDSDAIRHTFPSEGCSAIEGPVRIQYKWLVPIYVFPEMKLLGLVISKTEL
jgi:hypothetical protein